MASKTSNHTIFGGNMSSTTGGTLTVPTDLQGMSVMGDDVSKFNRMDVVFNVKTLTGSSPTFTVSVQERFNGAGFIETGNGGSAWITSTGGWVLVNEGQTGQTATAKISYGFAMLGKGTDKQVVFTKGGTVTAVSIDVYYCFYSK